MVSHTLNPSTPRQKHTELNSRPNCPTKFERSACFWAQTSSCPKHPKHITLINAFVYFTQLKHEFTSTNQ